MNEKELYQQKKQAQLDKWAAEVDKLKAKAAEADADARIEFNKEIRVLEEKIEEGKAKLAELSSASDGAWASIKEGVESAWSSIKSAFSGAVAKFKK